MSRPPNVCSFEKRGKKKKNSLKNGNIHIHAEVIFETRGKESLESKRGRVINIERSRRRGALSVHVETHLSLCLFKEEKAGILEESPTPFEPQLLPGRWIQRERERESNNSSKDRLDIARGGQTRDGTRLTYLAGSGGINSDLFAWRRVGER